MAAGNPTNDPSRQWFIVGRWNAYAGETRANLLRIVAIAAFYVVELSNYLQGGVQEEFHRAVTAIAAGWVLFAAAVLLMLHRRMFPAWLPFVSSSVDLLAVSAILIVGRGPQSPLVVAYLLVVVVSALRFQLRLIWYTTVGSMLAYLVVLGMCAPDWFGGDARDYAVPRFQQVIVLLAIGFTGILLGQVIRRVKSIAEEYQRRVESNTSDGE